MLLHRPFPVFFFFCCSISLLKKSDEFSVLCKGKHPSLTSLHFLNSNKLNGEDDVVIISSKDQDDRNGTQSPTFNNVDDDKFNALSGSINNSELPSVIQTTVLKDVYGALLSFREDYGHPNIPLGTVEGRKCETLRRLQRNGKLPSGEVSLLKEIGFRFDSLEDIYDKVDFDDVCRRLVAYRNEYGNLQVPKKFKLDPELGAWVAMVRRLGTEGVRSQEERRSLDEIGFEWKSTRKCGSAFMSDFREVIGKLEKSRNDNGGVIAADLLSEDKHIINWVKMQRGAYESGLLSDARVDYMDQLLAFGINWREI